MWNPTVLETTLWGLDVELRLFGMLSFLAASCIHPLYVWSMIKGEQTPPRSSWLLYLSLIVVLFGSTLNRGVFDAMLLEYLLGNILVVIFTIRYGARGWTRLETYCTVIVFASIVAWIAIGPQAGTVCSMIGFTVATLPLLKRVFKGRYESVLAWSFAVTSSALNVLDGNYLVSIWFMILQGTIVMSVIYHHKYLPWKKAQAA